MSEKKISKNRVNDSVSTCTVSPDSTHLLCIILVITIVNTFIIPRMKQQPRMMSNKMPLWSVVISVKYKKAQEFKHISWASTSSMG